MSKLVPALPHPYPPELPELVFPFQGFLVFCVFPRTTVPPHPYPSEIPEPPQISLGEITVKLASIGTLIPVSIFINITCKLSPNPTGGRYHNITVLALAEPKTRHINEFSTQSYGYSRLLFK